MYLNAIIAYYLLFCTTAAVNRSNKVDALRWSF